MPRYRDQYRRVLIDMHIPDWDDRFLAHYDPESTVAEIAKTGANALMVYFQSHVGLCYWPTESGQQHGAFLGSDPMIATLRAASEHDLPVCAYYSVNFNNWAYLKHPDWRMVPAAKGMIGGGLLQRERYGLCCFNNPNYRAFVDRQAEEILVGYPVDALFFDMLWWMSICECESCKNRYRSETGREFPRVVNWLDPVWCEFQAARERWIVQLATELRDFARRIRPGVDVYHNFALGMANWTRGVAFDSADGHDFLGGDFYRGREEQLVISRLMLNLSASKPVEFMTTVSENLAEHEQLKPIEQLRTECQASTVNSAAFLMVAPVDPDGRLNPAMLGNIRATFDAAVPFESCMGGVPVEDVGVYFSSDSKMSFAECGLFLDDAPVDAPMNYPHFESVRGACRALQRAHIPFGVVTRKQLDDLGRYKVIVLPNILRMDADEAGAFRSFVEAGGGLYTSGCTSLTTTDGVRLDDFMLADVFGCKFDKAEDGLMIHIEPTEPDTRSAIAPQRYLSRRISRSAITPRLRTDSSGTVLATLSLPLGYPSAGHVDGKDWSSIHSSPPWSASDHPTIVEHTYGAGRSIYSAVDLESGNGAVHDVFFVNLLQRMMRSEWRFSTDGHPNVWMTMFNQEEHDRCVVSFLHYPLEFPACPVPQFRFRLIPPPGRRFNRLVSLPDRAHLETSVDDEGVLQGEIRDLDQLSMVAAYYV